MHLIEAFYVEFCELYKLVYQVENLTSDRFLRTLRQDILTLSTVLSETGGLPYIFC